MAAENEDDSGLLSVQTDVRQCRDVRISVLFMIHMAGQSNCVYTFEPLLNRFLN